MKLEIKSYISGDRENIKNWQPKLPDDVYIQLEIEVGEKYIEGAHIFQLMVATPDGFEKHHKGAAKKAFSAMKRRYKGLAKNGLLIITDYTWGKLQGILEEKIKECEKNSWEECLSCLREQFFWEYEDIK